MVLINYLNPDFFIDLVKNENLASLYEKSKEPDDFIKCIDPTDLKELRQYFFPNETQTEYNTVNATKKYDCKGISLSKEEFVNVIHLIFGKEHFKLSAIQFFEDLQSRNIISDTIYWCNIIERIIEDSKPSRINEIPKDKCVLNEKNTYSLSHIKDKIINIITFETHCSLCYMVISMSGNIEICSENMENCISYEITPYSYRKMNKWISSSAYTRSGSAVFLSTMDCSLYVYNTSRLNHRLIFVITELPSIITFMKFGKIRGNRKLLLIIGDDSGNIHSLIFNQHMKSFFKEKPNQEVGDYFWSEIKNQTKWVTFLFSNKVHQEFVMNIEYITNKDLIISSSKDPLASIVFTSQTERKIVFNVKLGKTLLCFAYDQKYGLLATSCSDAFISLWHSNDPILPFTKLHGHEKNLIDLHFLTNTDALLSISEEGILKLWSTQNFKHLQTVLFENYFPLKNFMGYGVIFERLKTAMDHSSKTVASTSLKSISCEVLVVTGNTIKIFSLHEKSETTGKSLPTINLEPKIPSSRMIFKHYNRENPISFKELHAVKPLENRKLDQREDVKSFVKRGAAHLGLKIHDVDID